MPNFDYVLVGGGLQSGLLALALRARQPGARIAIVERDERLGGNHTWCFHDRDVPDRARSWLEPLVTFRWPGYRVAFPREGRTILEPYSGVSSDRLDAVVTASVRGHAGSQLVLGAEAVDVLANRVRLVSGDEIRATAVVDARGPTRPSAAAPAGYQKFLGLELELEEPHGLQLPLLMDATVDQAEGYRFFYLLPIDAHTLLVEDTYFHDTAALNEHAAHEAIRAYVGARKWAVRRVRREERGVLPMPWGGTVEIPRAGPLIAGYRGGWFHPGTGYSFPVALRLAEFVAGRPPEALFGPELVRFARRHGRQAAFARLLNSLLFRWYPARSRRSIFERFYHMPLATIGNYYALRLGWGDACRLLLGRPPRGLSIRHRLQRSPHR